MCTAPDLRNAVRGHWKIAHSVHDRRDVTLGEDASLARMGQAPRVLATLNTIVCGLTARAGATNADAFGSDVASTLLCGLTARAGATNLAALQRSLAAAVDRWLFRL